jgi:hypothetical protein
MAKSALSLVLAAAGLAAPALAQENVGYTWRLIEVAAGTNTPVGVSNGVIEPGEAARLELTATITPGIGSPVTYTPPPAPGVGILAGLGDFSLDLAASANAGAGSWSFLGRRAGWALGGVGTPVGNNVNTPSAGQLVLPGATANQTATTPPASSRSPARGRSPRAPPTARSWSSTATSPMATRSTSASSSAGPLAAWRSPSCPRPRGWRCWDWAGWLRPGAGAPRARLRSRGPCRLLFPHLGPPPPPPPPRQWTRQGPTRGAVRYGAAGRGTQRHVAPGFRERLQRAEHKLQYLPGQPRFTRRLIIAWSPVRIRAGPLRTELHGAASSGTWPTYAALASRAGLAGFAFCVPVRPGAVPCCSPGAARTAHRAQPRHRACCREPAGGAAGCGRVSGSAAGRSTGPPRKCWGPASPAGHHPRGWGCTGPTRSCPRARGSCPW